MPVRNVPVPPASMTFRAEGIGTSHFKISTFPTPKNTIDAQQESSLISQFKTANELNGQFASITFERLIELLKYWVQSGSESEILAKATDLQKRFSHLTTVEQQYFATRLVDLAVVAARKGSFSAAGVLSEPVVQTSAQASWQNKTEIANSLTTLARYFGQDRPIEAEHILKASAHLMGPNAADSQSLQALGRLHMQLKMFDQAARDYGTLVQVDPRRCDIYDLSEYVKALQAQGNKEKLTGLREAILARISNAQSANDFGPMAPISRAYFDAGLTSQGTEILMAMLRKNQELNVSVTSQVTQVIFPVFLSGERQWNSERDAVYHGWTDSLKQKYGVSSAQWLEAMIWRLRENGNNGTMDLAGIREFKQAKIEPGSIEQRLFILTLLNLLTNTDKAFTIKSAIQVTTNVPDAPDAATLYARAAQEFQRLGDDEQEKLCSDKCIDVICKNLNTQDKWLVPYIRNLTNYFDGRANNTFLALFVDEMKRPQDHESVVSHYLERDGRYKIYNQLLEDRLGHLATSGAERTLVEGALRNYVRRLQAKNNLPINDSDPDLDLVGQAYCLYLQPYLKSKWKTVPGGIAQVTFELGEKGLNSETLTQKSNSKAFDAAAKSSVDSIADIAAKLPGFSGLHFRATFDGKTGMVKVETLQKNKAWFAPLPDSSTVQ